MISLRPVMLQSLATAERFGAPPILSLPVVIVTLRPVWLSDQWCGGHKVNFAPVTVWVTEGNTTLLGLFRIVRDQLLD